MSRKIGIISSCGGHLSEIRALKAVYSRYEHFFVINDVMVLPDDMKGRTYFIRHSERDWKFFINLWEAWRILRQERPGVLLSTGAGPLVPFTLVAKWYGIRVVFIEIGNQLVRPSFTGRFMNVLADRVFYQWKSLARYFPRGVYGGPLL